MCVARRLRRLRCSLSTAAADKTLKIWDVHEPRFVTAFAGHTRGLSDCGWSSNARHIITSSDDATVRVYDVRTQLCTNVLKGHEGEVLSACFSGDDRLIASTGFDETVRLWDVSSMECVRVLRAHSDPVMSCAFSPDNTILASGGVDGICRIWDAASGAALKSLVSPRNPPISSLVFAPNGRFILISTLDDAARLWSVTPGKVAKTYQGHRNKDHFVFSTFSVGRNRLVVSGSEDGHVCVYDLQTQSMVAKLRAHNDLVAAVDAHSSRSMLASGGGHKDKLVKLWVDLNDPEFAHLKKEGERSAAAAQPMAS
jgi:COMPASS component SWD3